MFSLDFPPQYNDQNKVDPIDLFDAPTLLFEDARARMSEHLRAEARGCFALVLWLDCDREGENICFEVLRTCQPYLLQAQLPGAYLGNVFRARFSSLAPADLLVAMARLSVPNEDESRSVDARQLIDLKLGVAFSRFQTRYFRRNFPQLGKLSVTYGPCQLPTLWFCVHRHDEIASFVPRPFWTLQVEAALPIAAADQQPREAPAGAVLLACGATVGPMWSGEEAERLLSRACAGASAPESLRGVVLADAAVSVAAEPRPLPLNTLSMLREASARLGIGPGDAMHHAERLYLTGHISYPRTETCRYASAFDLASTLTAVSGAAGWLPEAAQLLRALGPLDPTQLQHALHARARQDGADAGDHPPITPVKLCVGGKGDAAEWALYQLICRAFVASLSDDALFETAAAVVQVGDGVAFGASATRCVRRGWTSALGVEVYAVAAEGAGAEGDGSAASRADAAAAQAEVRFGAVAALRTGGAVRLATAPRSVRALTQPPGHLTESELLGLMEAHSIGTDASMATHVTNVIKRGYAQLDEGTRQLVPAPLGLALVHAYSEVDEGLALPCVRASIEAACLRVARGEATYEEVVRQALAHFRRRYVRFVRAAHTLPTMLVAALAPSSRLGGVDAAAAGGDARLGNAAGFVGMARWRAAVERTASVQLGELLDLSSARVRRALQGADAPPDVPAAAFAGGAALGAEPGAPPEESGAPAGAGAPRAAGGEQAQEAAAEAAMEQRAIEEATAALALLGIVATAPPRQPPPALKPAAKQGQQHQQQQAGTTAPKGEDGAGTESGGRRVKGRKPRNGRRANAGASAGNGAQACAPAGGQMGGASQSQPTQQLNPHAMSFQPRPSGSAP